MSGLVSGVMVGAAVSLIAGLVSELTDRQDTSSPSPVISWRADRKYALVVGLGAGLGAVLMGEPGFRLGAGRSFGLASGLVAGVLVGLLVGLMTMLASSQVWPSSLALAQLAMRWRTPLRLMKFLDDARERNVLRTVGPIYQFRHARLQDRLARASDGSGNDKNTTGRPTYADHLTDPN